MGSHAAPAEVTGLIERADRFCGFIVAPAVFFQVVGGPSKGAKPENKVATAAGEKRPISPQTPKGAPEGVAGVVGDAGVGAIASVGPPLFRELGPSTRGFGVISPDPLAPPFLQAVLQPLVINGSTISESLGPPPRRSRGLWGFILVISPSQAPEVGATSTVSQSRLLATLKGDHLRAGSS